MLSLERTLTIPGHHCRMSFYDVYLDWELGTNIFAAVWHRMFGMSVRGGLNAPRLCSGFDGKDQARCQVLECRGACDMGRSEIPLGQVRKKSCSIPLKNVWRIVDIFQRIDQKKTLKGPLELF